ncbi:hypothetical protein CEXT_43051 [Caerostris extrusa]|uniref:Uncharacterized protein n=1 Tax=Caerostris extrusa TaxID=172846 RepID=A0AAV4WLA2_CAEEX|nr:hypothetical protein CEXT_43051 [Caerostris extrusa]
MGEKLRVALMGFERAYPPSIMEDDSWKSQGFDICLSIADRLPDTGVSSFMSNMIPATNCPLSPGMESGVDDN